MVGAAVCAGVVDFAALGVDQAVERASTRVTAVGDFAWAGYNGVVDVFEAAGLEKPELSILSDEFLAEICHMERKNLAVEALQKLLADEIKLRFSRNYAKDTKFSDLLNQALTRYRNGTIKAAQVIEELINIGQKIRQTVENGAVDGLSEDEIIFYDALVENGSAREVLGDAQLRDIAKVLLEQVRRDATIDWAERKNVQAKLKVNVKKTLAKYGCPPDQQALATDMVLEQAKRYSGAKGRHGFSERYVGQLCVSV